MMRALVAEVFTATDTYRLCIGAFPDNLRARRAYEAAGFQVEGVARGSAFFQGVHRDELVLAILRSDWEARCAAAEPIVTNAVPLLSMMR